ncbi:hypothetical protein GCM10023196_058130 [Actinoallomurus vinaceus]|uniref:DUF1345 domain-containing protein n=1 Tax=Actinoallomurus vinaceus TaxID=1080074 RepID=A0ABP8UFG5_9ACTN
MSEKPPADQHAAQYLVAVMRRQTAHLEKVLHTDAHLPDCFDDVHLPAWLRRTEGEQRLPVTIVVAMAIVLQVELPRRFALQPHFLLPGLEAALAGGLMAANPRRINRESRVLRSASLVLIAVITVANTFSAFTLVRALIDGTAGDDAGPLLATGAAIWGTNVIVFAIWYWELDRGGPAARALAHKAYPDFLFTQMQAPEMAPPDWEPAFLDYLYLSFTNATAFSPTDVMPLPRWSKMMMLAQSAVSIVAVALVIARAVNILK